MIISTFCNGGPKRLKPLCSWTSSVQVNMWTYHEAVDTDYLPFEIRTIYRPVPISTSKCTFRVINKNKRKLHGRHPFPYRPSNVLICFVKIWVQCVKTVSVSGIGSRVGPGVMIGSVMVRVRPEFVTNACKDDNLDSFTFDGLTGSDRTLSCWCARSFLQNEPLCFDLNETTCSPSFRYFLQTLFSVLPTYYQRMGRDRPFESKMVIEISGTPVE